MSKCTVFVGLDYHDSGVQMCVLDGQGRVLSNRMCANDWRSLQVAVSEWGDDVDVQAAIEACNGAVDLALELRDRAGWSIDQAHPGYVARIKQSPDKTDFSDARLLADLVRVGYLPRVWIAPHYIQELRGVVRYRQQLVRDQTSVKLRIGALLRKQRLRCEGRRWTKAWRAWARDCAELSPESRWVMHRHFARLEELQREIREADKHLQELTANDPVVARLLTFDAVGPVTAATLRAEIGRFDRFRTGKQLSRFCGVSPRNASSGKRQSDAGLIKAGNPELRCVLIETAHRLRNYSEHWGELGQRMKRRGKPACVIAAAIANRWVRKLYHEMKDLGLSLAG